MRISVAVFTAIALAGCTPPPSERAPTGAMEEMAPTVAPAGPITAQGVVTAITENTITLNHQPIDAIGWSAMTMRFNAEPALLAGVSVGDTVDFELESAENPRTITKLAKS